jgi:hypothetical protein
MLQQNQGQCTKNQNGVSFSSATNWCMVNANSSKIGSLQEFGNAMHFPVHFEPTFSQNVKMQLVPAWFCRSQSQMYTS